MYVSLAELESQNRMPLVDTPSVTARKFEKLYIPSMVVVAMAGICGIAFSIANIASDHFIPGSNEVFFSSSAILVSVGVGHIVARIKKQDKVSKELNEIYKKLEKICEDLQQAVIGGKSKLVIELKRSRPGQEVLVKEIDDRCNRLAQVVERVKQRFCSIASSYGTALSDMQGITREEQEQLKESVREIRFILIQTQKEYEEALSGKIELFDIRDRLNKIVKVIDAHF